MLWIRIIAASSSIPLNEKSKWVKNYDSDIPSAIPYMRKGVIVHLWMEKDDSDVDFEIPEPKHFALSGESLIPVKVRDKIYVLVERWHFIALNIDWLSDLSYESKVSFYAKEVFTLNS